MVSRNSSWKDTWDASEPGRLNYSLEQMIAVWQIPSLHFPGSMELQYQVS